MIGVMVGVDHVPDRLVRRQHLGVGEGRHRLCVVSRPFDHDEVVVELDEDAPFLTRRHEPDTIGDTLRRGARLGLDGCGPCWSSTSLRIRGHLERRGAVRPDVGQGQLQYWKSSLLHDEVHRILHATKVAIVRIDPLHERVARETDIDPRLDPLHEISIAERAAHGVLAGGKGNHALAANGRDGGRCDVGRGAFEEAVRRQPDVERSRLGAPVSGLVLDDVAWDRADATLSRRRIETTGASPARRPLVVDPNKLLPHGWHGIVHRHRVFRHREPRPGSAGS